MATVPRLLLAAASSSSGKTTIALGLMAALREGGLQVAPFKTGPDYIDPGYHTLAAGRPGRNLDAHLCGPDLLAPLFLHGCQTPAPADIAIIEGAMGLFDGSLGRPPVGRAGFGSSAHVAKVLRAPVLLVVDAAKSSTTVAAVVHGLASFDPDVTVAGVLLNKVGSARNVAECTRAVEQLGIPVVGAVPRSAELVTPSRHLGLVPAAERSQARDMVDSAAALVAEHVDLPAVLALARGSEDLAAEPWDPRAAVTPQTDRPLIAVAAGRAFTFSYPETTELLAAAGGRIAEFDPLTDPALPAGTSGLYLGGGFPEVHAQDLAANEPLRQQIRALVAAGLPTVAECAGLLYLCRSLDGKPMVGSLPLDAAMTPRLTLGYRHLTSAADSLLTRRGEHVPSHEFHRTNMALDALPDGLDIAWEVDGRAEGVSTPTLHASYQHLHWAGFPQAAQRFVRAAAQFAGATAPGADGQPTAASPPMPDEGRPTPEARSALGDSAQGDCALGDSALGDSALGDSALGDPAPTASPPPADLTHHGDQDLAPGLVDLAVNVHATEPPRWLADELAAGANRWAPYPDATAARAALAARHGVDESMVLPTSGAAEAFTLVARALGCRHALVVHPQFTEPEQALRLAGHLPRRLLLGPDDGFALDPTAVDPAGDLVVVGNPTNPTSALHSARALRSLARPGRVLLVDEAFMDAIPGEPESVIGPRMDHILVTRSLTKTWSLAGIRAGYVVGDPRLVARLASAQTPWSVSTPALDAMIACSSARARAESDEIARALDADRAALTTALAEVGLPVACPPRAPFVLVDLSPLGPLAHELGWARARMAELGFAVRRGETFPGLGPSWIRLAVRDAQTSRRAARALASLAHPQTSQTHSPTQIGDQP
ncbi:cobyrinate a,c-diamide synthase [Luteococcus sp. Sow4_B9]|uniref:cobyrinate a,c-diamide synthase n=1 Tax=Luteococcus sp. Sow4_B9 TaxID=3438792 RepID=UPI003F99BD42